LPTPNDSTGSIVGKEAYYGYMTEKRKERERQPQGNGTIRISNRQHVDVFKSLMRIATKRDSQP
jgi:hypothetical protein